MNARVTVTCEGYRPEAGAGPHVRQAAGSVSDVFVSTTMGGRAMRMAFLTAGVMVVAALSGCSGSDGDAAQPQSPSVDGSASPSASASPVGKPNGVEKLPADKILDRANKAALSARSTHLIGTSPQASLDLVVTQDSSDGQRQAGDTSLQTRVVDGSIFIKADADYWTEAFNAKTAKKIGKKWVTGDLKNPKLATFRQTSTMAPLMRQFLRVDGTPEVGEVGVSQGQPAVPVSSNVGTLWVATTGKPYPLLITSAPEQAEVSEVDFTDWNKKVVIKAPPKKQTISLADLA